MNETSFKQWLKENGCPPKVISDHLSRLRRLEREVSHSTKRMIDIDNEYQKDECKFLLSLFYNSGNNYIMDELKPINLPIGSYSLNTIKFSLRKYINFLKSKRGDD